MKKTFILSLIITFFTTQYTYLQASDLLCNQSEKMFNITAVERPEPEEMEFMFDQLALNEKIELINYNELYKLKYLDTELIHISMYNKSSYLLVKKEGNLIGAVNHYDGKRSIIFPNDIQPELICTMICLLLIDESSLSIVACPLLLIAKILYPSDQELHNLLYKACLNGFVGIGLAFACFYGNCY